MRHGFYACETVTYCIPDDCIAVHTPYCRGEEEPVSPVRTVN